MAAEHPRKRTGVWDRLDTPMKVISAAVVILGAVVGALFAVTGDPFSDPVEEIEARKSPSAVAAHQIDKCMRKHQMPTRRVIVGRSYARARVHKRCDWPPLTATSRDGYSEVTELVAYLPRAAAEPYNAVHTLRASCARLGVSLVLNHMFGRVFRDVTIREGRVMLATTDARRRVVIRRLDRVPDDVRIPDPQSGVFHVLKTVHISLLSVRCQDSPD